MYFNNNNSDTNIDKEFSQNKNILSQLNPILNKYKLHIFIILAIVLVIIMIYIFANNKVTNYLTLTGEGSITVYQGTDYIEPGYSAYNSKNKDLTDEVEIKSTLDMSKIGEYEITYTIGEITKVRKIYVVEKPKEYTYIYLKTVNDNINVYLKLGEKYIEPGYQVFSSTGKNLTSEVKVTGTVNTSKKGNYEIIYSVVDSNNVTISATRTVIVMDTEISLTLSKTSYVNTSVNINVGIIDNYFDYIILPDNTKVSKTTYSYSVSKNGTYTFKVYNKKGIYKEASIEVKNINKTSPTGNCSGNYKNGVSTINVSAQDDIGINKYVINGVSYTSGKITIKKEMKTVNITIYDKAGNTQNISCTLKNNNKASSKPSSSSSSKPSTSVEKPIITSDPSITMSYQYVSNSSMPYGLFTPSSASSTSKIPLIVWLHGSGEIGITGELFKGRGLVTVLNNWKLQGFNAYVICPHLSGAGNSGSWTNTTARTKLNSLIEKMIKEKSIDPDKIILSGHSAGGMGTLYMAYYDPNQYSALAVLSGYDIGKDLSNLKKIPTRGYTENSGGAYSFMSTTFVNTFGSDKLTTYNSWHGNIPNLAFNEDKNSDSKSDLIEWMLIQ